MAAASAAWQTTCPLPRTGFQGFVKNSMDYMGRVYVYYIVIHIYIYIYVNLHIFQYVIEFKMIYLVSKYLLIFLCIYDKCRYVYRYIHIIQDMHVFIVSSYIAYNNYIMCSLDIIYMINIFHIFYR